jgi:uncharacterized membrane protein
MKCSICRRENEKPGRFCIFCGAPLLEPVVADKADSAAAYQPEIETLLEEVRYLKRLVLYMNERIEKLEKMQGSILTGTQIGSGVPGETPADAVATAPLETGKVAPPSPSKNVKVHEAPRPETVFRKPREWEQILGGNWLARVGVVALIIGAAFFLKLAIDRGWLGPAERIIIGVIAGLGMVGGGYFWQKRYPALAQALCGGGIAVLYLSIFASFAMFSLLNLYLAVCLLFTISAGSALLAVRFNSLALAIIGITGAFTAPFILGAFEPSVAGSVKSGQGYQLLIYILIVDCGVLALSAFRNWRWFSLLALSGSLMAFRVWYDQFGSDNQPALAVGGLTLIYLIFGGMTVITHIIQRKPAMGFDLALMVMNAAAYFGVGCGLMQRDWWGWLGLFSLLLALIYGGIAYISMRREEEVARLKYLALGIAIVLITIAVPLQLGDSAWTTVIWAAEAVGLMWLSFFFYLPVLRSFSYGIFVLMALRLFFFDTFIDISTFHPIFNERMLAFLSAIAAFYLSVCLLQRYREKIQDRVVTASILLVAANILTIWVLSFEIWNYLDTQLDFASLEMQRNVQNLSLTGFLAVYAMILLVIGIIRRYRLVRLWALGLLLIPIIKVFVYDVFNLEQMYRIIAFVGLGVLLLSGAYLYQRYNRAIRSFLVKN